MSEMVGNYERTPEQHLSTAVKDFYFSFRFSQGEAELQKPLIKGVVSTYDNSMINVLNDHDSDLFARFGSLRLPGEHVGTNRNERVVQREFMTQGNLFLDEIARVKNHPEWNELAPNTMALIVDKTIKRDVEFVLPNLEKPRAYNVSDPYESYFREYIMRNAPTGSAAYDKLFHGIQQAILNGDMNKNAFQYLDTLARRWERLHPGEMFCL